MMWTLRRIDMWMVCRRSAGSSRSVARVQTAPPMILPASASSSSRMFTGANATSGRSGSALRSERYRRMAPAHMASATSLTVTPAVFATSVTRYSGQERTAQRRGPPGAVPKIVLGARRAGTSSRSRYSSRISGIDRRSSRAAWTNLPLGCAGFGREGRADSGLRRGCGAQETRTAVSCGSVLSAPWITLAPDVPSASAWCALMYTAKRPSSRPSIRWPSHKGFRRSSALLCSSPSTSKKSCWSPGAGKRR